MIWNDVRHESNDVLRMSPKSQIHVILRLLRGPQLEEHAS